MFYVNSKIAYIWVKLRNRIKLNVEEYSYLPNYLRISSWVHIFKWVKKKLDIKINAYKYIAEYFLTPKY